MTEMDIQSFFYLIKKSSEDLGNLYIIKAFLFWNVSRIMKSKNILQFQCANNS
jgi:hypothetical protein